MQCFLLLCAMMHFKKNNKILKLFIKYNKIYQIHILYFVSFFILKYEREKKKEKE